MNVEKLLSVAERQQEQFDCITACIVTGLKYFDINVFTLFNMKAEVSKQFGWPHGSTFGNYKRIIQERQIDINIVWPVINLNQGTRYTKNQQLLKRAKELISNDNVVLCTVQVDSNNVHCHVLLKISNNNVDYWDPATSNSNTSSLSEYLDIMNTDMLAIAKK